MSRRSSLPILREALWGRRQWANEATRPPAHPHRSSSSSSSPAVKSRPHSLLLLSLEPALPSYRHMQHHPSVSDGWIPWQTASAPEAGGCRYIHSQASSSRGHHEAGSQTTVLPARSPSNFCHGSLVTDAVEDHLIPRQLEREVEGIGQGSKDGIVRESSYSSTSPKRWEETSISVR